MYAEFVLMKNIFSEKSSKHTKNYEVQNPLFGKKQPPFGWLFDIVKWFKRWGIEDPFEL